jgi:hypothetical protein
MAPRSIIAKSASGRRIEIGASLRSTVVAMAVSCIAGLTTCGANRKYDNIDLIHEIDLPMNMQVDNFRQVEKCEAPICEAFHRLFCYSRVPYSSPTLSMTPFDPLFGAEYSPLNSVVYPGWCMNPVGYGPRSTQTRNSGHAKRARRAPWGDACRLAGTDLYAVWRSGSSPRSTRPSARPAFGASEFRGADEKAGVNRLPVSLGDVI